MPSGRGVADEDVYKWKKAMVRAKTSIVLTLDVGPLAQMAAIIDDDSRTAKDLWDFIHKFCTEKNTQAIINLHQDLEKLQFKDREDFEKHL